MAKPPQMPVQYLYGFFKIKGEGQSYDPLDDHPHGKGNHHGEENPHNDHDRTFHIDKITHLMKCIPLTG